MSLTKCDNWKYKNEIEDPNYIVFSQFNKESLKISYL